MKLVVVEGAPDLILVRKLGWTRKESRDMGGRGNVANWLAERTGMTALVDEDPGQPAPRYRSELSDAAKEQDACVLRDGKREHRVVVIRPRLEEWIIKGAQETGVAMSRFGFSERGREFDDQIMLRLRRFEDLLDELLAQQCARLLRLRELLRG